MPIAEPAATSGVDRFADLSAWMLLPSGEPAYTGPVRILRARTINRVRTATATVLTAEALEIGHKHVVTSPDDRVQMMANA